MKVKLFLIAQMVALMGIAPNAAFSTAEEARRATDYENNADTRNDAYTNEALEIVRRIESNSNPYKILGLDTDSPISQRELRKHFLFNVARKIHPDKSSLNGISKDRLTAAFQKANNAYDDLRESLS